jgi:hypothetical protein
MSRCGVLSLLMKRLKLLEKVIKFQGLKLAEELSCVEYFEVGANALDKNLLDSLYEKYVKEKHEQQLPTKPVQKKKKFFIF